MNYKLRAPLRLKKPEVFDTLDLKDKEYLMFNLIWDEQVEQTRETKMLLSETFAILPPCPIIFPVPAGVTLLLLRQIRGLRLNWIPGLNISEIKYLEHHSMGVVNATPFMTENGIVLHINFSTNPRRLLK